MNILHILNGDATLQLFKQSGLPGDHIVWREVLSDGTLNAEVASEGFWQLRVNFFEKAFKVKEQLYREYTIHEFDKIVTYPNYHEVVLWYEYDLFCQVNYLAIHHWLYQQKAYEQTNFSFVCVGNVDWAKKLMGLGEFAPDQYQALFQKRISLTAVDFEYLSSVWQAYASPTPDTLWPFIHKPKIKFHYLPNALQAHLRRFPSTKNGLNEIENYLLFMGTARLPNRHALIKKALHRHNWYGFGDLQYLLYLERIDPLFESFEPTKLNDLGVSILNRKLDFLTIKPEACYLGGACNLDYRWDPDKNQLIPEQEGS
ncbi:hypothetical protein AAG747_01050 [Rapidithrix thailandica]|uniref:DUF1835 domain-containing protein n=1 Tax=Rapidithrix thailandica TaxID=413964 RepID=A0AAW9RY52_9BACT